MQSETDEVAPAAVAADRLRPRWLFRGGPGAWDALMAALADDPTSTARWPIAPSGPSMAVGDPVLLWRSGRGGGIAALCTVMSEPEAEPRPGRAPDVVVGLRMERAYAHPIAPTTLVSDPLLRPLAFLDLLDATEHRVTPAQEEALAALIAAREHDPAQLPDGDGGEGRVRVAVPERLVPLVTELMVALGAEGPAATATSDPAAEPTTEPTTEPAAEPTAEPTALQVEQASAIARSHGQDPFTVEAVATVWRTGVGTARSRLDRLVDSGLVERAGTDHRPARPGERPTRGRPPVLYRLTAR